MVRILIVGVVGFVILAATDCYGQQSRVRIFRKPFVQTQPQNFSTGSRAVPTIQASPSRVGSKLARLLDGPMTGKYRNPHEVESRYFGGFHESYYQNLGIPSGDIGLRGNGINWWFQ